MLNVVIASLCGRSWNSLKKSNQITTNNSITITIILIPITTSIVTIMVMTIMIVISVSEIASRTRLYYAKINVACRLTIDFYDPSSFANTKYLHNISDNKLNQAFLIYFFYQESHIQAGFYEAFVQSVFNQIHTKCNGLTLGD